MIQFFHVFVRLEVRHDYGCLSFRCDAEMRVSYITGYGALTYRDLYIDIISLEDSENVFLFISS